MPRFWSLSPCRLSRWGRAWILCLILPALGCSGDLPLARVEGTVTYKGAPVPEATVTFISESAPPAIGVTNDEGKFELITLGRKGAALGPHTVSVIALKDSREITPDEAQSMKTEALSQIRKSLIPEKYGHPRTSGLAFQVSRSASDNQFRLELVD